ncbi:X-Pro dipeptidase [Sphaerisporangium krabiense]|uniref:Xaa-Pro aminopeptidase n=1 Tax=Sphaerisporangium krabiense TaxID=763782 RepID=A0A7W8Z8G5_9ACTN|nr:Xaa-Pro peptidase family protein [Sphaerisporangium krabiense]MBB5629276.1 Xaa-Pro aminopeptidase [Sphaerisporangium krabiense]GII67050.1 X-Pro dipeptidase [Sphaerisporangium krabiense]
MTAIHHTRRTRLAALLAGHDVDALLVTRGVNVRYLTGLASSNAAVLVRADASAVLATDSRYIETARRHCAGVEVVERRDVAGSLAGMAARPGIEAHDMSVALYRRLGGDLVPLDRPVEALRVVKDESEIDALRVACELTDQAFADVLPAIAPGTTERELARALEARMGELGADRPAFDTIVASGPNGSVPHHAPTARPIERGDLVTMDFGALYQGYHADMTRTVAVGEPAAWQRDLYELVLRAQRAGREALAPGADIAEVDGAARGLIEAAGHGEHFGHGLGHGVGLEIHEDPFLRSTGAGRLEDRVPITVEPGVYLPGRGGVRIEDTLVTRAGGPELLTRTTKELLVL